MRLRHNLSQNATKQMVTAHFSFFFFVMLHEELRRHLFLNETLDLAQQLSKSVKNKQCVQGAILSTQIVNTVFGRLFDPLFTVGIGGTQNLRLFLLDRFPERNSRLSSAAVKKRQKQTVCPECNIINTDCQHSLCQFI